MRYRIALTEEKEPTAYWVTRFGDTDNYSYDFTDATVFASKSAAKCLMDVLKLDADHYIEETF